MVKNNDNDYHIETRSRKRKYEDTINENNTEENNENNENNKNKRRITPQQISLVINEPKNENIKDKKNYFKKKKNNYYDEEDEEDKDYEDSPKSTSSTSSTSTLSIEDVEDENGNLKGFVVDDEDDNSDEEDEDEEYNDEELTLFGEKIKEPLVDLILKNIAEKNEQYNEENEFYNEEFDGSVNPVDYYEYVDKLNDTEKDQLKNTISRIKEINSHKDVPLKYRILSKKFDDKLKAHCLLKYTELECMTPLDSDKSKYEQHLETLMDIPFGNYVVNTFNYQTFKDVEKNLNEVIYGMDDTKENIMSFVANWINNTNSLTNPIALMGPPGTGKTTIVRDGIAKSLNRPFIQINLGGFKDSNSLLGHDLTYVGSKCGLLVESLISAKVMNPIIYFDELDKIPEQAVSEISGVLIHLIDPSQNSCFKDKYFSGVNFDFSKALFIFSFNDVNSVDKILLDRLMLIKTKGYKNEEKRVIASKYMFPDIINNLGLKETCIKTMTDDNLNYIIDNYTSKEEGVRNMRRCIHNIYSKLNLYNLILKEKDDDNMLLARFKKNKKYVEIKKDILDFNISNNIIDLFLDKSEDNKPNIIQNMYL